MKKNLNNLMPILLCVIALNSCLSFSDLTNGGIQEQLLPTKTKFEFPATWTPIPITATPSPIPPTQTPVQFPDKPELVSYTILGGDGSSPEIGCLLGYDYLFKLYTDGQLIYLDSSVVKESYLTEIEVQELMAQIERTGYQDIEGTGELREKDPIYENAPASVGDGGAGLFLAVNDKRIKIYSALEDYVVDPIKQTLEIISSYRPEESHNFSADLILLWIFPIDDSESKNWYPATPIPPIQEWPETIRPLRILMVSEGDYYAFIGGIESKTIFEIHGFFPSGKVYTDNGQEYYVIACPIEP